MKIILASRAKGPSNRAEAWACLTANLGLPGSGSLMAGKAIGYYQMALAAGGLILTLVTCVHLSQWMLANWTRINLPTADPFETLSSIWQQIRWPLVGMGIFAIALLWAAVTSMQVLAAHPKNPPVPPRIGF